MPSSVPQSNKHLRVRDKVGCRNEFGHKLQNLSESFDDLDIIRNTIGKHQGVINRIIHRLFL